MATPYPGGYFLAWLWATTGDRTSRLLILLVHRIEVFFGLPVLVLAELASVYLALRNCPSYCTRKVWRACLEVVIKIKGSQGQRRVVWIKPEHPFTAISPMAAVHANHNKAQHAALRRRCSVYRRCQNLYAKTRAGLQRVLDVQRIIHNWVRPHWGLGKRTTPAMAIGLCSRSLSTQEILGMRGFQCISS